MTDPFDIEGPVNVSFSGGRTSGYMLHRMLARILDRGGLRSDVEVLFANTGKERPETLDFVHEVETRWDVPIRWLERHEDGSMVEVDYATANRTGAPFRSLILERNFLPNPVMRFCTTELKIRIMRCGFETWTSVIGLRADEPRRVANQRAREASGRDPWSVAFPLFDAGVTKADVDAFWKAQPFDLRLRPWEGNCDLCFLKGKNRKLRVIRDNPELVEWWIERERELIGIRHPSDARFRHNAASYAEMAEMVRTQPLPMPLQPHPARSVRISPRERSTPVWSRPSTAPQRRRGAGRRPGG